MRESIRNGCKWVVLGGRVHDVSAYMKMHPGGAYLIERYVGQDISAVFFGRESPGLGIPMHAHSRAAHKALSKCLIGVMKAAADRRSWVDDVNFGTHTAASWHQMNVFYMVWTCSIGKADWTLHGALQTCAAMPQHEPAVKSRRCLLQFRIATAEHSAILEKTTTARGLACQLSKTPHLTCYCSFPMHVLRRHRWRR